LYSGDYSFAELIGRSPLDPELRRTQSDIAVTSYTLAYAEDVQRRVCDEAFKEGHTLMYRNWRK